MVSLRCLFAVAASALVGCGSLIDPNVASVDLTLSSQEFAVDIDALGVGDVGAVAATPCTGLPTACSDAAAIACPDGACSATCNEVSGTCDVAVKVVLSRTIDLQAERPELASIDANAFVSVEIERLQYQIADNTLTVATPEFGMYSAPVTVMDPDDPAAGFVASMPSAAPMEVVPITDMETDGEGLANLSDAMIDFKTPFAIIVAGEILVDSQTAVPSGTASVRVLITASASL